MNLLQKMQIGMGCPDWHIAIHRLQLKDFCGSTALGMLKSEGMNGQIDWQGQQTSCLVCSFARQWC